jgi:hypothetical protein
MKSNKDLEDILKDKFSDLELDSKTGWEKLSQKLDEEPDRKVNYTFLAVASIIGILITIGVFIFNSDFLKKEDVLIIKKYEEKKGGNKTYEDVKKTKETNPSDLIPALEKPEKIIAINKEKIKQVVVRAGETKLEYILSDSSKVLLNKYSKINLTSFREDNRILELNGEAYFEVKNKSHTPFTIICGQSFIEVIGTSFNIRSYGEDSIEVFVEEGKVKFGQIDNAQLFEFLLHGEKAVFNNKIIKKALNNDPNYLLWKTGLLSFNKTKVSVAINTLEEYFHVKINVAEPTILNCHLSGKFKNPDLKTIFTFLSKTLDIECTKENGEYFLKGKGCN